LDMDNIPYKFFTLTKCVALKIFGILLHWIAPKVKEDKNLTRFACLKFLQYFLHWIDKISVNNFAIFRTLLFGFWNYMAIWTIRNVVKHKKKRRDTKKTTYKAGGKFGKPRGSIWGHTLYDMDKARDFDQLEVTLTSK
jgi:hypothetical protein